MRNAIGISHLSFLILLSSMYVVNCVSIKHVRICKYACACVSSVYVLFQSIQHAWPCTIAFGMCVCVCVEFVYAIYGHTSNGTDTYVEQLQPDESYIHISIWHAWFCRLAFGVCV